MYNQENKSFSLPVASTYETMQKWKHTELWICISLLSIPNPMVLEPIQFDCKEKEVELKRKSSVR